jgi:hypothetical protein
MPSRDSPAGRLSCATGVIFFITSFCLRTLARLTFELSCRGSYLLRHISSPNHTMAQAYGAASPVSFSELLGGDIFLPIDYPSNSKLPGCRSILVYSSHISSRAQIHLFQSPSWVLLESAPSLPLVKITITITITQ